MVDIQKILPQDLDPNKKYLIRTRSINAFGNTSDWSDSLYLDTSRSQSKEGLIQSSEDNFSIRNSDGEIVLAAFTAKEARQNRIKNPSFEISTLGWEGLANSTLTQSVSDSFIDAKAAKIAVASATKIGVGIRQVDTDYTNVSAGETYSVSAHVYRSHASVNHTISTTKSKFDIKLNYYDVSDVLISTNVASEPISIDHNVWSRISLSEVEMPAGVTSIGVEISYSTLNEINLDENEVIFIDGVLLEESPTVNSYFDGASVAGTTDWDGTVGLSTSTFDNTSGNTLYIKGDIQLTGNIQSTNYDEPTLGSAPYSIAGLSINTSTGSITTPQFVVSDSGVVSIGGGSLSGLTLGPDKIYLGVGTHGAANTPFYVDNTGDFSLKDKFVWDQSAGTLDVIGNITGTSFSLENSSGNELMKLAEATWPYGIGTHPGLRMYANTAKTKFFEMTWFRNSSEDRLIVGAVDYSNANSVGLVVHTSGAASPSAFVTTETGGVGVDAFGASIGYDLSYIAVEDSGDIYMESQSQTIIMDGAVTLGVSGNAVKAPGMPYFMVRNSNNIVGVPNNAQYFCPFNIEASDSWGMHSGSNSYVTIPVSGVWSFTASVATDNINVNGIRSIYIYKGTYLTPDNTNDARYGSSAHGNLGGQYGQLNSSAIVQCTAGQTIGVGVYQQTGALRDWGPVNRRDLTVFSGQLLWAT